MTSKPIRVYMLVERFSPVVGGAENQVRDLSKKLIENGIGVKVITQKIIPNTKKKEIIDGVPIYRINTEIFTKKDGFASFMCIIPFIVFLIKQRKDYDILTVRGSYNWALAVSFMTYFFGSKSVFIIVTEGDLLGKRNLDNRFKTKIINILKRIRNKFLNCNYYVSVSNSISKEFYYWNKGNRNLVFIESGVDISEFRLVTKEDALKLRHKLNIQPNEKICVFSGKIIFGKGLDWLLIAWRKLISANFNNVKLLILGGISSNELQYYHNLNKYIKENGLDDNIIFCGEVSNVKEYLQAADIFIFPSRSEGLPISVLEAMSCALPVIGSRVGGIVDLIDDGVNGFLVEMGDVDMMCKKLQFLLENDDVRQTFGISARKKIEKQYSLEKTADRYIKLYNEILLGD